MSLINIGENVGDIYGYLRIVNHSSAMTIRRYPYMSLKNSGIISAFCAL